MPTHPIAFLGFGNVGRALARLLLRKQEDIDREFDLQFCVTGIATGRLGQWIDPQGIDLDRALTHLEADQPFPGRCDLPIPDFFAASQAQVIFESIPVNYETGQPAVGYLRAALEQGRHAISANKGPVVHAYRELTELARSRGVQYLFESAVMDGAPIFSLARETLPGAKIEGLRGILNSTTNLILERMETGETLEDAVSYAQAIGIAESDPMGDLDGWDSAVKVAALCTVLMRVPLKPQQVQRRGILGITPAEIEQTRQLGQRWKLVCSARVEQGVLKARVAPEMVGADSPFYNVSGTSSIVTFETDVLPALSIVEGNPTPETTAYGMLADFIHTLRK
jgi:homoserine dehydrogenase